MIQVEIVIHYEQPRQSARMTPENYKEDKSPREVVVRSEFLDTIDHSLLFNHVQEMAHDAANGFNLGRENRAEF